MSSSRKTLSFLFAFLLLVLLVSLTALSLRGEAAPLQPTIVPTFTPFTPAPHFAVTIPQKGLLKNYLTVSVKADPGTSCKLTFIPHSGEILVMDTIANTEGECVWRWKLEESYGKGHGRLIFTINGVSDTHFIEILSNF